MNYHNILPCDMLNGEGLRVVLWVSGCIHDCPGCFNKETHDPNSGIKFEYSTLKEIMYYLDNDYIDGLTLTGGDPLYPANREVILGLCEYVKEKLPQKTIWLYTGYLYENIKDLKILDFIDVLCDGPYISYEKNDAIHWVGSTNQRVIDVKESKKQNKIVLWEDLF